MTLLLSLFFLIKTPSTLNMHSSLILSLLFILNYLSLNVECRTCKCADFSREACETDPMDKCEWNTDVPQSDKNNLVPRGECRTEKYMNCKRDPTCTLAANDPQTNGNKPEMSIKVFARINDDAEINDDYRDSNDDQTNGIDPTRDIDYPYDCQTGEYHKYAIDVSTFRLAAKEMQEYERQYAILISDEENILNNGGGKSVYKSFTRLQIVAGISFIIILVAAMIYYQCKRDEDAKKYISLSTMDGSAYATFNDGV